MTKTNKQPRIRFEGYQDDWEQCKLGDFLSIPEKEKIRINSRKELMIVKLNLGGVISGSNRETLKLGSTTYYKRYAGQFIYGKQNFFNGSIAIIPEELDGKATSGDVPSLNINNIYTNYFYYYISREDYWKSKESKASGTGSKRIHETTLFKFKINVPTKFIEQQKIGDFFKSLDDTIALHQEKLDSLKNMKKSYLQKMFPKKDKTVPEIRFAGFTDDWEQRKLGEVSERIRGNDGRMDLPTLTISARKGWLDQRERFSGNIAGTEQKNYTLLSKNELSYNKGNSKLAKYGVVYKLSTYEEALVPKVYHSFRTINKTDPDYIEYMFATKLPDRELGKLVTSGARMDGLLNINYDDFMGIRIKIPYFEEQQKIGTFFRELDDTIALHQEKLELLKETKKSFLQKMFV